jgi:hypothetical protein
MRVERSRQARVYYQCHPKFEQPAAMAEDSILISNLKFSISNVRSSPLPPLASILSHPYNLFATSVPG